MPNISDSGPSPALQAAMAAQASAEKTADALLLASGETVMMTTDGITEAWCAQTFLSMKGAAARAEKARPTASLRKLSQAIYRGACDFAGGSLRDDVCLLLARHN